MLNAKEADELFETLPIKVSDDCDKALDIAIVKAIESWKRKIDIALWFKDCPDDDVTIRAFLEKQGYKDIDVKSDYPWYCETYVGKTFIKFNF